MRELRISQRELTDILDPIYHRFILKQKLRESGFDLTKTIEEQTDIESGEVIFTQSKEE